MLNKTDILGVEITTDSEEKILEYLNSYIDNWSSNKEKIVIFTPNPEQITAAQKDPKLMTMLNQAQIALPDGVGLVAAAKLLGKPVKARIAGVDFMKNFVKSVSKKPVNTGYFGGEEGVAEATANCLKKLYPDLHVSYMSHIFDKDKMIQSDIDILFVAMGFPKQEKFILEHKDELPAKIFMSVGGSFDFISGRVPRAPKFLRSFGLEWLFRLVIQPWRIFRQAQLLHFSVLILLEALSSHLKSKKNN